MPNYLLRSLDDALNSPASMDKIVIAKEVTLDAGKAASINLFGLVRNGAPVNAVILPKYVVANNSITVDDDPAGNKDALVLIVVDQQEMLG